MSIIDFYAGNGDRLPSFSTTMEDNNGPIDLTGATVIFKGRKAGASTMIGGNAVPNADQVNNKGQVAYPLASADTVTGGMYFSQFVATIAGKNVSAPNNGADRVWVNEAWTGVNE